MTTASAQSIESVGVSGQDRAVATITMAFSGDPVLRWVFPDAHDFLSDFPRLVRAFGGGAFANGSAHAAGSFAGVALWLPPGVGPDEEAVGAMLDERIPDARKEEMFAFVGQLGEYHIEEPHWYLPFIGVDPSQQGNGYGSALLRHALAECDKAHLPAYLEASSPRNKPLYERHGFEAIGEIRQGNSPPLWPMVRKAR